MNYEMESVNLVLMIRIQSALLNLNQRCAKIFLLIRHRDELGFNIRCQCFCVQIESSKTVKLRIEEFELSGADLIFE